jgi:triacylglycerol lipase
VTIAPLPLARLCAEAYTRPPDIARGEARAVTAETEAGFVVAFQGTRDARQALDDLDIRPRFVAGLGYVHRGFWELAEPVTALVVEACGGRPLVLAGHSLGAAIALLVAARIALGGVRSPAAVIGFGPPRVSFGGRALARVLKDAEIALYRNGLDAVPDLPPAFRHPVEPIPIGRPGAGPLAAEEDHAIARYVAALSA